MLTDGTMMERYVITRYYTATYTGSSEFYTGLRPGDRVRVEERVTVYAFEGERRSAVSLSAQRIETTGAWMVLGNRLTDLTDIQPEEAAR